MSLSRGGYHLVCLRPKELGIRVGQLQAIFDELGPHVGTNEDADDHGDVVERNRQVDGHEQHDAG